MKRFLAAVVTVLFTYTSLVTPWVEASFWDERRKAVAGARSADGENAVGPMAGLPSSLMDAMPGAQPALANVVTRVPDEALGTSVPAAQRADFKRLPQSLKSLPMNLGEIRQVFLAKNFENRPIVVHIQDVHGYTDAQLNIAGMVEHLADAAGDKKLVVGVEGAAGAFRTGTFRAFPDKQTMKDVAGFLLDQNMIAAPEYAAWTSKTEPVLWGVENPALYLANGHAYKDSIASEKELKSSLTDMRAAIEKKEDAAFSPALRQLDIKQASYQAGKLPLGDYLKAISATGSIKRFPNLSLFMDALSREGKLDFAQVERERSLLIRRLADALSKPEIDALIETSLAYRSGKVSYGAYYNHLSGLCESKGVALSKYPAMKDYIAYVLSAERIEKEAVFTELNGLEKSAFQPLLKTSEEKELHALGADLTLAQKASDFAMTPDEWAEMEKRLDQINALPQRLAVIARSDGPSAGATSFDFAAALKPAETFCRTALARNDALVGNLLSQVKMNEHSLVVLIAGGFHTEGLVDRFKKQNVSVVVVTPQIKEIKEGNHYLDFLREKTPLEKLFTADVITYAKAAKISAATSLGDDATAALNAAVCLAAALALRRAGNFPSETQNALREMAGGLPVTARVNNVLGDAEAVVTMIGNVVKEKGVLNTGYTASPDAKSLARDLGPSLEAQFGPYHAIFGPVQRAGNDNMLAHLNSVLGQKARSIWAYFYHASGAQDMYEHQGAAIVRALTRFKGAYGVSEHGFGRTYLTQDGSVATLKPWERLLAATAGPFVVLLFSGALIFSFGLLGGTPWGVISALVLSPYWMLGFGNLFSSSVEGARGYEIREALRQWWTSARLTPAGAFRSNLGQNGPGSPRNGSFVWGPTKISSDSRDFLGRKASLTPMEWFGNIPEDVRASHVESVVAEMAKNSRDNSFMTFNLICFLAELRKISNEPIIEQTWNSLTKGDRAFNADKFIDDLTVAVFSERADLPAYASAMLDAGSVEALGWDMAGRLSDLVNKLIERANTPERRSKVLSFLGQVRLTALNDKGIPYQTSRDFQTLALAAMTVIHSIENGVNGAGAWRVTTVEAAMLTSEEHGKSFLDKRFLVEDVRGVQTVGPFAMENEDHIPGFYFRGIEDTKIKYGGDGREILYYMFHGLNRDPQKPADRSKFHITVGLLPGRGTGAGHQQGPWQDLKYGAGGNGVQLCVVPSDDGSKPARVTAQVFGKGTYAQADPMTQESILALGELSVAPEDVRLRRDPDGGYTMVDTNGRNVLPKPVDAGVGLVFFDFSTNLAGKDVLSGYAKAPLTNGLEKAPFSVVIDRDKSIRLVPQGAPLPVFQAPAAKNADLGVAKGADGIRSLCANADSRPLAEKLAERAAMNTIMHRPTALKSETVKMTWGEENWHGSTQKDKGKDKEKGTGEASLLMPDGREMLLSNFINMNPHVLGRWTRLLFGDNLPIFTKFLTTNFPPFVHLGFKRPVSSEEFMDWITTERNLMRDLHGMLSGQLDGTLADEFLKAYSEWAMKQSLNPEEDGGRWRNAKWDGEFLRKWKERGVFKTGARMGSLQLLFEKIRENRASYCDAVNLVPLEGEMGNTFVSFAGLAHAIAGLSEQVHPRDNVTTKIQGLFAAFAELERQSAPDQAFIEVIRNSGLADLRKKNLKPPKNEGWIVTMIGGKLTLVEPQQMSNETLSYMDFTTPFKFAGGGQGFIFRKGSPTTGLEDRQLAEYAKEMSLDPMSPSDVRYKPVPVSAGANSKDAKLFKLTDDPEKWPFYTSYSLELGANGEFQGVPPKETYQKIVLLEGEVELHHPSLDEPILLSPDHPCAIIWATVQGPYTLRSRGGSPARVMFEGVPTWNRTTPAGLPVATLANVLHALHSSKVEDAFDMLEQIRLGGGMNAVIPVLTAVFKEKHKGNSVDFDSLMTKLFPTDMDLIPWAVHPAFYEVLAQEYGSISASSRLPSLTDVVERAKSDLELTYFQLSTLELFLRTAAGWAKDTGSDRADEYAGLAETIANEMSRSLKSFDEDRARRVINEENGVMDNLAVIKDKDRPPAVAALLRELQTLWLDGILETKGKVEDFLARLEINFPAMTPIVQAQRTIFDAVKKGEVNAGLRSVTADPDKMTEPDSYESKYTVPALAAAAGAESRQLHSLVGIKALWAKILFYPSKVVYEGIGFVVAKLFGVKNVKVNFWEGTLESPQFESNASWGRARYLRDLVISVSSPAISVLLAWALSSLPNMLHIAVKTAPGFESTMFWLKIAIVAVNLILTYPLLFQGLNIIPIGRVVQGKGGEVFAASRGFRALKDLMGVINPKRGLHLKSTMFSLMPKPTRLPGGSERTLKRMLGIGALLAVSLQALPAMAGGFNYVSAAGPWGGVIPAIILAGALLFGGIMVLRRRAASWKGKVVGGVLVVAGSLLLVGAVVVLGHWGYGAFYDGFRNFFRSIDPGLYYGLISMAAVVGVSLPRAPGEGAVNLAQLMGKSHPLLPAEGTRFSLNKGEAATFGAEGSPQSADRWLSVKSDKKARVVLQVYRPNGWKQIGSIALEPGQEDKFFLPAGVLPFRSFDNDLIPSLPQQNNPIRLTVVSLEGNEGANVDVSLSNTAPAHAGPVQSNLPDSVTMRDYLTIRQHKTGKEALPEGDPLGLFEPQAGTSGFRVDLANFTDLAIYMSMKATLEYLKDTGQISGNAKSIPLPLVGDRRPTTTRVMVALAKAITDAGFRVEYQGRLPTPALTLHGLMNNITSVMSTVSHNPIQDNGAKANKKSGELLRSDIMAIQEISNVLLEKFLDERAKKSSFDRYGYLHDDDTTAAIRRQVSTTFDFDGMTAVNFASFLESEDWNKRAAALLVKDILARAREKKEEMTEEQAFEAARIFKGHYAAISADRTRLNREAEIDYVERYQKLYPKDSLRKPDGTPLKLVLYRYMSVGFNMNLLRRILENAGAEVIEVGDDEIFAPIDTEALEDQHLALFQRIAEKLAKGELEYTNGKGEKVKAPIQVDGVVTEDGDADRPLVVGVKHEGGTAASKFIPGGMLVAATAFKLNARGLVLAANAAHPDLEAVCRAKGIKLVYTRVGSPEVVEGMIEMIEEFAEKDASAAGEKWSELRDDQKDVYRRDVRVVGGEANGGTMVSDITDQGGHIIIRNLMTRDALLPILSALTISAKENNGDVAGLPEKIGFKRAAFSGLCDYSGADFKQMGAWVGALTRPRGDVTEMLLDEKAGVITCLLRDGTRKTIMFNDLKKHLASLGVKEGGLPAKGDRLVFNDDGTIVLFRGEKVLKKMDPFNAADSGWVNECTKYRFVVDAVEAVYVGDKIYLQNMYGERLREVTEAEELQWYRTYREQFKSFFPDNKGFGAVVKMRWQDGVRMTFRKEGKGPEEDEEAHLRPSGNAAQMRIYAVAGDEKRVKALVEFGTEKGGPVQQFVDQTKSKAEAEFNRRAVEGVVNDVIGLSAHRVKIDRKTENLTLVAAGTGTRAASDQPLPVGADGNVYLGNVQAERVGDSILLAADGKLVSADNLRGVAAVIGGNGNALVVPVDRATGLQAPMTLAKNLGAGGIVLEGECPGSIVYNYDNAVVTVYDQAHATVVAEKDRLSVRGNAAPAAGVVPDNGAYDMVAAVAVGRGHTQVSVYRRNADGSLSERLAVAVFQVKDKNADQVISTAALALHEIMSGRFPSARLVGVGLGTPGTYEKVRGNTRIKKGTGYGLGAEGGETFEGKNPAAMMDGALKRYFDNVDSIPIEAANDAEVQVLHILERTKVKSEVVGSFFLGSNLGSAFTDVDANGKAEFFGTGIHLMPLNGEVTIDSEGAITITPRDSGGVILHLPGLEKPLHFATAEEAVSDNALEKVLQEYRKAREPHFSGLGYGAKAISGGRTLHLAISDPRLTLADGETARLVARGLGATLALLAITVRTKGVKGGGWSSSAGQRSKNISRFFVSGGILRGTPDGGLDPLAQLVLETARENVKGHGIELVHSAAPNTDSSNLSTSIGRGAALLANHTVASEHEAGPTALPVPGMRIRPAVALSREIAGRFHQELDRGLAKEPSSLATTDTLILGQPTGNEEGDFVVVDFGGTNARFQRIRLSKGGKAEVLKDVKVLLSERDKEIPGDQLFAKLAGGVAEVLGDVRTPVDLGFIFSFPAKQNAIDSAVLTGWRKGFTNSGVEGQDVVKLFQQALNDRGLSNVTIQAVVNDTAAIQVRAAHKAGRPATMGLIMGTGHNISIIVDGRIYNLESGNFSKLEGLQTEIDMKVLAGTIAPKSNPFEKMTSSKYVAEILRQHIMERAKAGGLFTGDQWKASPIFKADVNENTYPMDGVSVSVFAGDRTGDLSQIAAHLREKFGIAESTPEERQVLKEMAMGLARRSAEMIGAILAAGIDKVDPKHEREHFIGADGSFILNFPGYQEMVREAIGWVIGEAAAQRVSFSKGEADATAKGGAVIAAMAKNAKAGAPTGGPAATAATGPGVAFSGMVGGWGRLLGVYMFVGNLIYEWVFTAFVGLVMGFAIRGVRVNTRRAQTEFQLPPETPSGKAIRFFAAAPVLSLIFGLLISGFLVWTIFGMEPTTLNVIVRGFVGAFVAIPLMLNFSNLFFKKNAADRGALIQAAKGWYYGVSLNIGWQIAHSGNTGGPSGATQGADPIQAVYDMLPKDGEIQGRHLEVLGMLHDPTYGKAAVVLIGSIAAGKNWGELRALLKIAPEERNVLFAKIQNVMDLEQVVASNEGPQLVAVVPNKGDGGLAKAKLEAIRKNIFRADGTTEIRVQEEPVRLGQVLAILKMWRAIKDTAARSLIFAGLMTPGKSTRQPLALPMHGVKSLPMLIRTSANGEFLLSEQASIYSWTLVSYTLRRLGFKGQPWKWLDEPQFATNILSQLKGDWSKVDVVRVGKFVKKENITDYLAENKEWQLVNRKTGEIVLDLKRRPKTLLDELVASVDPNNECDLYSHMGSPGISDELLTAALNEFGDLEEPEGSTKKQKWIDVDGVFVVALTHSEAQWDAELEREIQNNRKDLEALFRAEYPAFHRELEKHPDVKSLLGQTVAFGNAVNKVPALKKMVEDKGGFPELKERIENLSGFQEVLAQCPDYFARIQRAKAAVNLARGRAPDAAIGLRELNFGENPYWGDIGSPVTYNDNVNAVNDRNSAEGLFARYLAKINGVRPDANGNILVGDDCVVPTDGSVKNCVLIHTKIYGSANKIENGVLWNSEIRDSRIGERAYVYNSQLLGCSLEPRTTCFKCALEGHTMVSDPRYTRYEMFMVPADLKNVAAGMDLYVYPTVEIKGGKEKDINHGSAENYKIAKYGRESFDALRVRMRQNDNRTIPSAVIEGAIDANWRNPLIAKIQAQPEASPAAVTLRALVVDDDPPNRNVVKRELRYMAVLLGEGVSFDFVEANDGVEALEKLEAEGPFDLIVMDGRMPRMSGSDAIREARRRLGTLPPTFLHSAEPNARGEAQSLGVGFLPKAGDPVSTETRKSSLRDALAPVVAAKRTAAAPAAKGPLGFSDWWPKSWATRPVLREVATLIESIVKVALGVAFAWAAVSLFHLDISHVLNAASFSDIGRAFLADSGSLAAILGGTGVALLIFGSKLGHRNEVFDGLGWRSMRPGDRGRIFGVGAAMALAFLVMAAVAPVILPLLHLTLTAGHFFIVAGTLSIIPATGVHLWINERRVARARRAVEDFSAQAVALGQKHAADPASAEADLQTYFQDAARTFAPGVSLERMVPEVQDFGLGGATTSPFRMRASGASRHEVAILRGLAGLYNNARLLGGAAGRAPVPTPGTNIGKTNLDFVAVPMFSDGSDLPGTKKAFDQLRDKAVHALDANSEMPVQVVFPLSQGLSRRDAERAVRKALVDRLGSSRGNSAFAKLSLMVGDQFMTNGAVDMEKVANEVSPNWRNSFNLRLTAVATEGILLDAVRNAITLFLINLLTGEPQPVSVEQGAEALRYADINA